MGSTPKKWGVQPGARWVLGGAPPGPGGARMPRSLQLCCSTAGFPVPKPRSSLRVDPILFFIAWYIRGESAAAGWKWCTWGSGWIWGREGFRKQGAAGDIPSACSDPPVVGAGGNPEGFGAVLSSGGAVLGRGWDRAAERCRHSSPQLHLSSGSSRRRRSSGDTHHAQPRR